MEYMDRRDAKFEDLKKFISEQRNLAEEFVTAVSPEDTIILWGGGIALYWYNKFFQKRGIQPSFIIDKNPNQQGKVLYGMKVVSPAEVLGMQNWDKAKFVVTAPKYRDEIINEIRQLFGNVKIYSFEAEIYYTFIPDVKQYREYLLENFDTLRDMYYEFSDEKSKDTLVAFVKGRISAEQEYFIRTMVPDQYFPKDIIQLSADEVIVEAGSNDGRTLKEMIDITNGKFKRIYCFEPDRICIEMLKKIITDSKKPINLVRKGVGASKSEVRFKTDSIMGGSRVVTDEDYDYKIDIIPIDDAIDEKVTMMKMDIEGLEFDALQGAERILREDMPKLAICVYHDKEDIIRIWQYLKNVQPKYKFYLRHHNWGATETVLYALPEI